MFTAESEGERILKIGQHLAKLSARVRCSIFDLGARWLQLQVINFATENVLTQLVHVPSSIH